MDHQDWTPVVFRKKSTYQQKETVTVAVQPNQQNKNKPKLKDDDEIPQIKTYGTDYGIRVSQARCSKKLSQKQLATQINEKIDVIKSIENGKGIYNPSVTQKVFKILAVKRNN
jgi:ribosome-binding protein aMBF1 (putative translation factor)